MYFMPKTTVEDDLAGVSALMLAIPDKLTGKKTPKSKKKPKSSKAKYKATPKSATKTKKRGKK
jgi:hypothetical protein